jgi:hypothetical protein
MYEQSGTFVTTHFGEKSPFFQQKRIIYF